MISLTNKFSRLLEYVCETITQKTKFCFSTIFQVSSDNPVFNFSYGKDWWCQLLYLNND